MSGSNLENPEQYKGILNEISMHKPTDRIHGPLKTTQFSDNPRISMKRKWFLTLLKFPTTTS